MKARPYPPREGDDDPSIWELVAGAQYFDPTQLSAVKAWLRNTATAGSVASVTDVLNVNPATQATAGNKPTGTTLNGLPALSFDGTDDWLAWPLIAANNGSPTRGFAFWFQFATVVGLHTLIAGEIVSGVSAATLLLQQNATDLFVIIYVSAGVARRGTAAGVLSAGTPLFITMEYDGAQALETDECIITINGVKQTLVFVNDAGAPNDMPDTLVQPTGSYAIGVQNTSTNQRPLSGIFGSNIYALGGAGGISGGGLLTSGERTNLMNFEKAV